MRDPINEPQTAPVRETRPRINRSTLKSELRSRIEGIRDKRSVSTVSQDAAKTHSQGGISETENEEQETEDTDRDMPMHKEINSVPDMLMPQSAHSPHAMMPMSQVTASEQLTEPDDRMSLGTPEPNTPATPENLPPTPESPPRQSDVENEQADVVMDQSDGVIDLITPAGEQQIRLSKEKEGLSVRKLDLPESSIAEEESEDDGSVVVVDEEEDEEDEAAKRGGFVNNLASGNSAFSNLMSSMTSFLPTSSTILGMRTARTEAEEAEAAAKRQKLDAEAREGELKARRAAERDTRHREAEEKQRRAEVRRRLMADAERIKDEERKRKEEQRRQKRREEEEMRKKQKLREDKRKEERRRMVLEKAHMMGEQKKTVAKRLRVNKAPSGIPKSASQHGKRVRTLATKQNGGAGPSGMGANGMGASGIGTFATPAAKTKREEGASYDITPARETVMELSDEEEDRRKDKKIPQWARVPNLAKSADTQPDPDGVFVNVPMCNLREVFGSGKMYRTRSSSANWTQDRVTAKEMMKFKKDTGAFKEK